MYKHDYKIRIQIRNYDVVNGGFLGEAIRLEFQAQSQFVPQVEGTSEYAKRNSC